MSYADYSSRPYQRPRHDTYYTPSRDTNAYSRHEQPSPITCAKLTAMRYSVDSSTYSKPNNAYHSYEPRATPPPQPLQPRYRTYNQKPAWPPLPRVEDEKDSLAKEVSASAVSPNHQEGEPPVNTRGAIDQESLLDDIEQATPSLEPEDRRFVLLSEPSTDDEARMGYGTVRDRRKSFAERGNMAPIKTDLDEPPVFTERVSTPYAYTKPQRETTAPSSDAFVRSPDPFTPANSDPPQPVPSRHAWDVDSDEITKLQRPTPSQNRHNSFSQSRPSAKSDAFDDSDLESEDTTRLRTERKPARYSFVKNDLQRDYLRTDLRDTKERPQSRRRDARQRSPPLFSKDNSFSSTKDNAYFQSSRSSSSSLNDDNRKPRPAPVDTEYSSSSRMPSRPSSPLRQEPSPKLPTRLRDSPPNSRPSSRGNPRPASPLSYSTTLRPPSPGHFPVTDADWHATYPPSTRKDKSRPSSRLGRHETIPSATPRIDVHSPSPARPPQSQSSLPYPVEDFHTGVFMPTEGHYQFDHVAANSPRQAFPDSPRASSSSIPGSPRLRDDLPLRPSKQSAASTEEPSRTRKPRSNSFRSTASDDERPNKPVRKTTPPNLDKPLPSCPRIEPSARYEDWYTLKGYTSFDICPTCYEGVFADTPFASDFSLRRRDDRERYCDFSSPWLRLAWLLTIKQRRQTLNLIYRLVDIADDERPCPGDRELGTDRITWYGIPDQRDGVHVANFAVCPCDKKMIEVLFPTMTGYFTKLPSTYRSSMPETHVCSLRTSSRRFPTYLDLLVELDAEAQSLGDRPNMTRFVQLARENAFKGECARDKLLVRKPWHFIPSLPELTVCEECYDEIVWPALQSKSVPSTIPRLMNKAIQLVPGEDPDLGSSCCLYSPRMRWIWETAVREEDLGYLKRKAVERKRAEEELARDRKTIIRSVVGTERGSRERDRARAEIRALEKHWAAWE